MRQKMTIVTLGVANLARSLQFYRDGLGWQLSTASEEGIAFFDLGGVGLALYPRELLAEDATVCADGSGFAGVTLAQNAQSRAEVDEVLAQAKQAGATIVKPAQQVFWGGYSGYFADPDGHLWEVAWNPFIELDENGALRFPK